MQSELQNEPSQHQSESTVLNNLQLPGKKFEILRSLFQWQLRGMFFHGGRCFFLAEAMDGIHELISMWYQRYRFRFAKGKTLTTKQLNQRNFITRFSLYEKFRYSCFPDTYTFGNGNGRVQRKNSQGTTKDVGIKQTRLCYRRQWTVRFSRYIKKRSGDGAFISGAFALTPR